MFDIWNVYSVCGVQTKPSASYNNPSPDLPFSSCSIVTEHDCNVKQEQVFLSCGCSSDHYIRPQYKGCAPCPAGSVLSNSDNMSCVCGAGLIWDNEQ